MSWHPYGNPNASGSPGQKSASRAEALRAELKEHRARKDFSPEYWSKVDELDKYLKAKKAPDTRCTTVIGHDYQSQPVRCSKPAGHEGSHRANTGFR